MADTPDKKTAVVNTAKVAGIVALLPSLFSTLPQNVALIICATMVTCAAITASVPAPTSNRVLIALYQAVRVIGLGIKYAIPYAAINSCLAASLFWHSIVAMLSFEWSEEQLKSGR